MGLLDKGCRVVVLWGSRPAISGCKNRQCRRSRIQGGARGDNDRGGQKEEKPTERTGRKRFARRNGEEGRKDGEGEVKAK